VRLHTLSGIGDGRWTSNVADVGTTPGCDRRASDYFPARWQVADLDGNGRQDLVNLSRVGDHLLVQTLTAVSPSLWTSCLREIDGPGVLGNREAPSWSVADTNGDGRADLIRIDVLPHPASPNVVQVSSVAGLQAPELLTQVNTSTGGTITVSYKPASEVG